MKWTGALGTSDSGLSELALGEAGEPEGADVSVDAGLASGTGAASGATPSVFVNAGLASGSGSALNATVSTVPYVSVSAELASGTGAAQGPTPSIAPNAGAAAGTGAASNATVSTAGNVSVNAGLASGTGSAQNAAVAIGPVRFYLNTRGWPQVRPLVDSGWENANLALELWHSRRMMYRWHGGSEEISGPFGIDNQAAIHDLLMAQYISEPLAAQTITGTIRAVIQAVENNASANMRSQMHAWVMAPDGSVRGTLTTFTTGGLSSEWNTSRRSAFFPVGSTGTAVTSTAILDGDRVVVDLGARIHDTSATAYNGRLYLGDGKFSSPGTSWDLPSDQTNTTTTHNGWIEFSAGLVFLPTPVAIEDDIANAVDCMPDAEGSVTAYAADVSGFTTEADDPDSMFDVNYSGDLGFTGWTKLVGPTGGARVKIDGGGGLGIEPFIYVFDDPPASGSAYESYRETADSNAGPIFTDVPDGVTKYVAIMPGDGSFEDFGTGDENVYLVFSRARAGDIPDLIVDAPDLLPAAENTDVVAFSPDIDFWTTETDDPQYIIDNIGDPLGFTGWFKLDVPAGPGTKVVDIDTYLPIDYAEGPEDTALFVFDEVPTLSSVPVAEAYFSPDGSPPAGSIDQGWGGKAKIPDLELSSGTTYYVAVVPLNGSFWEHWAEGTNLQLTVHRQTDSPDVDVFPEVATGTGQAYDAPLSLTIAGVATGAGQAYDALVNPAMAGVATGSGSAFGATPSVAPHAGAGSGTGTAHRVVFVEVARGTGAAHDAAIYAEDNYAATPEGDIATGYMPPLAAPIDDNDTTIIVQYPSTTNPDEPFVVLIGGEQVLVTNVSGTTWTVERGYNGTTATAHGSGTVARPALVRIRVDGVDIAADVDYRRSRFTTGANGQAGTAEIWVRDLDRTRSFVTGVEVVVSFRGINQWGGYLASIRRQYVFAAGTGRIGDEPRWLLLDCVDYNVLFNKRIFFKPGDADRMAVKHWANGTWDSVVIDDLVHNFLTLGGDGLRYDIQHVGTPALPQISCNPDAPDVFGIGSAGWTWGQVMQAITSQTGAVYYIDPDKTFRYVDDSTKQSRFGYDGLSDSPTSAPSIVDRFGRNVVDGWGAGFVMSDYPQDPASASVSDGVARTAAGSEADYLAPWSNVSGFSTISFGFHVPTDVDDFGSYYQLQLPNRTPGPWRSELNIFPNGDGTWNANTNVGTISYDFPVEPGWYTARAYFGATGDKLKIWRRSSPEPSAWSVEAGTPASTTSPHDPVMYMSAGAEPSLMDNVRIWSGQSVSGPGTLIGYRDVEFALDGSKLTNDHLQWGAGQGRDEMVFARTIDQDSINDHGLWQTAEVRFDMYCQESVDRRGETWVYGSPQNRRGGKDDRFFSRVTVREPYFRVADVVQLESVSFDFTEIAPVRNAEITFPTPWDIRSVLTIAHEIDAPWSTFEFWMPQFDFDFDLHFPGPPQIGDIWWPPPWGVFDPCETNCDGCIEHFLGLGEWGQSTIQCAEWTDAGSTANASVQRQAGVGRMIAEPHGFAARYIQLPAAPEVMGDLELLLKLTLNLGDHPPSSIAGAAEFSVLLADGLGPNAIRMKNFVSGSAPYGGANHYTLGGIFAGSSGAGGSPAQYNRQFALTKGNNTGAGAASGVAANGDEVYLKLTYASNGVAVKMWLVGDTEPGGTGQSQTGNSIPSCQYIVLRLGARETSDVGFGTSEQASVDIDFVQVTSGIECSDLVPAGSSLGLPGFGQSVVGWSGETGSWTDFDVFVGPKQLADQANASMSGGSGSLTSYLQDVNNGVGAVALNLGPPFDPDEDHSVLMAVTILDQGSNWALQLDVAGDPGGTGGTYDYHGYGKKVLDVTTPPGDYLWRVGVTTDGTVSSRWWAVGDTEPAFTNTLFVGGALAASPTPRIIQLWLRNDSNTVPVDVAQVHITSIDVNAYTDTSNCADAFDRGGLIAAWGSPDGSPGGSWAILEQTYLSQPEAFEGNGILEGIYGSDVNDLYYGGVTYLSGATFDDVHAFLVTFVVGPMCPTDNASSNNAFRIAYASDPDELDNPGFGFTDYMAVFWNNNIAPFEGYGVAGVGNFSRDIEEGVTYAARFRVDQTAGSAEFKFWEPGAEDEPSSYSSAPSLGAGVEAAIKIGLDGGNVWPAGTRPEVNGVTYWLGYGEDASVPAAPGNNGCTDCGDAAPGEFEDPTPDGPADSVEPRSRDVAPGPNGGVVFHTPDQFQVGSSQVWVNGLRIKIGSDYIESPRQAMIEILDHIVVDEDAEVLFSYIVWTIDDPIPE